MMSEKIIVSGVGCCLVDLLFTNINFGSDTIRPYLSLKRGDGGLTPGHLVFREEFEKVKNRSKALLINEFYATTSTFGILSPNQHETLVTLIDGELPNMDWYEENKHTKVALSVLGYIVGNALFNYALPKPMKELLELYYRIMESDFFSNLGFTPLYFDAVKETFDQKEIKNAVRKVIDASKEKYPKLSPDFAILDYKTPCRFARTYLMMILNLDLTSK